MEDYMACRMAPIAMPLSYREGNVCCLKALNPNSSGNVARINYDMVTYE